MKALVLVSGGVDSATCLGMAVRQFGRENVTALTAYYGQKHDKEIDCAKDLVSYYGLDTHIISDLSSAFSMSGCPLLKGSSAQIDHLPYVEQLEALGGEGTVATYVPFRNGLMLSYAASIAISVGASIIYYGAHADDAAGRAYPDCTPEFTDAMRQAIFEGSGHLVGIEAPLLNMNKRQVVALGLKINVPYELTWSCYEGNEKQCGKCGTCIDRKAAFEANGVKDPVGYEE